MDSTSLRALSALAVGLGLGFGAAPSLAQFFEGEDANVGFGRGEESDVLYVTWGKSLYKIKMAKDGYQLPGSN